MSRIEFKLQTSDGLTLHGQGWAPAGDARAVVCLVHGHGEHSERYADMGEVFSSRGLALVAFDLRGHGRSQGRRGHAPDYAALMSDISLLLEEAESRYPGRPRFLYGHSLGGNLAAYYALSTRPPLAGVILSAPLFRLAFQPPKWKTALLNLLYAMHLNITMRTGLERDALTRDEEVLDARRGDPLGHRRITPQLAVDMLRNGEWMLQHAAAFPLPVLLMHGRADRVTSPEASMEFASRLGTPCTLKIWSDFYHELHNEPEQQQVFECVLNWIDGIPA